MSSNNPIGGGPVDPYDKYNKFRVEGVERQQEREKKGGREFEHQKTPLPEGSVLIALVQRILKFFKELGSSKPIQSTAEIQQNLREVKLALEAMGREDKSREIAFLEHFAYLWHVMLENATQFSRESAYSTAFRKFLKEIYHYPEGTDFPLGYYLAEYTGEKWLPFPFMDLIAKLHQECKDDPFSNPVIRWSDEIDHLISVLNTES